MKLALIAALAVATPAGAQERGGLSAAPPGALRQFSTDRPDETESPYTLDAGHVQVEAQALGYTRDRAGGVRIELIDVGTFNLKLGVAHSADVQLVVEPYLRRTVVDRATGARDRVAGFGDVTVRLKRNLWGDDGGSTALAVMPYATLPTARHRLGSGKVEFGLIVPFAWNLANGLGLGAMAELDVEAQEEGGGYALVFVNSVTLGADVTDELGAYAELFTERSAERGSGRVVTGDVGVTYRLRDDLQLDAGANIGLTREADDLNMFVGVSRRF